MAKIGGQLLTPDPRAAPKAGPARLAEPVRTTEPKALRDPTGPMRSVGPRAEPSDLAKKASRHPPLPKKLKRVAETTEEFNFLVRSYNPRLPQPRLDRVTHTVLLWRGCTAEQWISRW